jgi:uncharacterized phiE125 gp8 family phage protein
MELTRTSTTAVVLDLADLKDHLSIDGAESDAVIMACQRAAVDLIERECGIQIGPATFTLTTDFPPRGGDITLPKPPLVSVDSVQYLTPNGTSLNLGTNAFRASLSRPGRLRPTPGRSWPETAGGGAVTIDYAAGNALNQVPEGLLHAIRLLTGHYFENREATSLMTVKDVPFAVEMILNQFKFVEAV